ncbi:MAG: hypothetical protein ACRDGV_00690 [Candidatus Limnocylindria bacterium]
MKVFTRVAIVLAIAVASFMVVRTLGDGRIAGADAPSPAISPPGQAEASQRSLDEVGPAAATPTTYRGPRYDTTEVDEPTMDKPQSKLWFNDGAWWAAMLDVTGREYRIHRLDWATQEWHDTGVVIDERPEVHADALWDGSHLYVASAGPKEERTSHAARILRFSYDPESGRYSLDPDFPVTISDGGVVAVTIAKDTTEQLWVSYIAQNRVFVNRSLHDHYHWGEPFIPPVDGTMVAADESAIISYASRVGVVWTNQNEDAVYFATHPDDAPDDAWNATSTVVQGLKNADDHLSVRALEGDESGRLFVAVKTSLEALEVKRHDDPQIMLLVLEPDGTWRKYLYGRVGDQHTRPVVVIDEEHRDLYIFATQPGGGGTINYKVTSLDRISFPAGHGTPLIDSAIDPLINNATATKQNVNSDTGLVVLAADGSTGRYLHAALSLDGVPPGTSRGDGAKFDAADGVSTDLVHETFDPWSVAAGLPDGWSHNALEAQGTAGVTVAADGSGMVGYAISGAAGQRVEACRRIPPVSAGTLVVQVDVLMTGLGTDEATITSVRDVRAETANVELSDRGTLMYMDGSREVNSGTLYQAGVWYRSTATVDFATGTYAWDVVRLDTGDLIFSVAGAQWRDPGPHEVDRVCLRTPEGASVQMLFDNVRIQRQSG